MKKFSEESEFIERLKKVNYETGVTKSGIQMFQKGDYVYIDDSESSNLVIGSTGSGKTQIITMPLIETAILAGESFVVTDAKGDIKDCFKEKLEKNGYNILTFNFGDNQNSTHYNPFDLARKYYNDKRYDKASLIIDNLAYYLLAMDTPSNADPFWTQTATALFVGLTFKLLEEDKKLSVRAIYEELIKLNNSRDELNNLKEGNLSYDYLINFIHMPPETWGSVLSVLNNAIKLYGAAVDLNKIISDSTFDFEKVISEKTAIFIIGQSNIYCADRLIPLFVDQLNDVAIEKRNQKRINIILDEFGMLKPIKNFQNVISYSRAFNLRFTVIIQNLKQLEYVYGEKNYEVIKLCFANIIYLLSNDINTINEILDLCLLEHSDENIIELKTMKVFEAIIIRQRLLPFKTKLLPFYAFK